MIKIAETEEEIRKCFPVMAELRPHFTDENEFVEQVKRQTQNHDFRLFFLDDNGIKTVGGIRVGEWLARGKYLEIEDLVTTAEARSKNYGEQLFDWIETYARQENCTEIKLVSAVTRYGAHKFYLNKKMILDAHFFSKQL
ncbi:MAG: GNAT family N-acetyltransferase [Pyrinomonadaceae bacterium]|nr:GNAT family N-acetyltransferase [Pyrinomonadaceae bacterium]